MTAEIPQSNKHIKTIHEFMGVDSRGLSVPEGIATAQPPDDIPGIETGQQENGRELASTQKSSEELTEMREVSAKKAGGRVRALFGYLIIFLVAFGIFYTILNFEAVSKQLSGFFSSFGVNEAQELEAIPPQEYQKWFRKYYAHVNDSFILGQGEDPDGDSLVNANEYYLGTNPLKNDTDGDGIDDGQEVVSGTNPLYEGRLLPYQQEVVGEFVNSESVESRKSLERAFEDESAPLIANFTLDPSKPGNITIPKLGVNVAIIWSKTFEGMEDDLKYASAHHPGTVYPGQKGTASIHGHSSGNPWDGNHKTIFTKLNFLEPGDEVIITVFGTRGESKVYRYAVSSKKVYAKDDPAQFEDLGGYHLNLSTSWPVGTARDRYVVTTELVGL